MLHRLVTSVALLLSLSMSPVAFAGSGHNHDHGKVREVPADQAVPSIDLTASRDPDDGFNLHLIVENFRFSPERAGIESGALEGHAHLYVNGAKIGRVYGDWVHLPAKLLTDGDNIIRVTLNDNVHQNWGADGKPIEAMLHLTKSADDADPARHVVVDLDPSTQTEPPVVELAAGERVVLMISGADSGVIHIHGYDMTVTATAGQTLSVPFTAAYSGRFPAMMHVHDELLGDQEKALFYLDIRAR